MRIKLDMRRQDPNHLPYFGTSRFVRFLIVGLGGTGGYLFYYLSRLIASKEHPEYYQILLADGDLVEEKNLIRQNFVENDIGISKVRVLSERYGNVYNMNIPYYPDYIENADTLLDLINGEKLGFTPRITVLLGCVDNNKTRQLFDQIFYKQESLVYIDSGNDQWAGQVVMGLRGENKTVLPPVGYHYPDILEDKDTLFPTESCEVDAVSSPQNIATNITAATIMFNMVNQLITDGTEMYGATFDAKTSQTRALWLEGEPTGLPYPYTLEE